MFGEWGAGKSSIIKTMQTAIEKNNNKTIKFITYDAWKYTRDSFRRTFLMEVGNALGKNMEDKPNPFYSNTSIDTHIKSKFNREYIKYFILALPVIVALYWCFSDLGKPEIVSTIAIIMAYMTFLKNSLTDYKTTVQTLAMFAPEQFEKEFDDLIKPREENKIVIIIDNLDRCDKDTACATLSDIKGFLEKDKVIFLIPVDDASLLSHIRSQGYENENEAQEYLRKIFNVIIRIKKVRKRDLFIFTQRLIKKYNISFNPNTISIIAQEYARNPRRIIQTINNLQIEKELINNKMSNQEGDEFISKNETLIAFFLILREEWEEYYQSISINLAKLKDEQEDLDKRLQIFLKRTKGVWENSEFDVMEKIIFNLDNDETISLELKNKIDNEELQQDDMIYSKEIIDYLIEELEKEIEYETFETRALMVFRTLLKVFEMIDFKTQKDIPNRLLPIIKDYHMTFLKQFDRQECERFFKFIESNRENVLCQDIVNQCTDEFCSNFTDIEQKNTMSAEYEKYKNIAREYENIFITFVNEVKIDECEKMSKSFFWFAKILDMSPYLELNEVNGKSYKNNIITNDIKGQLLKHQRDNSRRMDNFKILYNLAIHNRLDENNTLYYTELLCECIIKNFYNSDSQKYILAIIEAIKNSQNKKQIDKLPELLISVIHFMIRNTTRTHYKLIISILESDPERYRDAISLHLNDRRVLDEKELELILNIIESFTEWSESNKKRLASSLKSKLNESQECFGKNEALESRIKNCIKTLEESK